MIRDQMKRLVANLGRVMTPGYEDTIDRAFDRIYQSQITQGASLTSIGDCMRAQGISLDMHRLLSWFFSHDMTTISRALQGVDHAAYHKDCGQDVLTDKTGALVMHPVNLGHILRNLTDLRSRNSAYVHKALYGPQPDLYHFASYDTLALHSIYRHTLRATTEWFSDIYG